MPKLVSEITSGAQDTQTRGQSGQGGDQGAATRVFRVLLNTPGEPFDAQTECGISLGGAHPRFGAMLCTSVDSRFDGESRMVALCTFLYQGPASDQVGNDQPPGNEQATWSLSSSLIEQPAYVWRKRNALYGWVGDPDPAVNSAGDIYDAITQLSAMINVSISQIQIGPSPLFHLQRVGYVNSEEISLGPLKMKPHTVMFRGLQAQPFSTVWRNNRYTGFQCTYEFAYKPNETTVRIGGIEQSVNLGWDIAVPQTGFNCKAWADRGDAGVDIPSADPVRDPFGQPLRHENGRVKILDIPIPRMAFLPLDVSIGDKVRAMVKVFSQDGGVSQAPSASPIPLNDDGTPRKESANPKVLVYGYAVQPELNFTQTFGLRLQ